MLYESSFNIFQLFYSYILFLEQNMWQTSRIIRREKFYFNAILLSGFLLIVSTECLNNNNNKKNASKSTLFKHIMHNTHILRGFIFQLANFQSSQQSQVMWLFISFPSLFFFKFKSGFRLPLMLLMHISQFLFLRKTIKKGKKRQRKHVMNSLSLALDVSLLTFHPSCIGYISFISHILFFIYSTFFCITLCSNNSPVWEII